MPEVKGAVRRFGVEAGRENGCPGKLAKLVRQLFVKFAMSRAPFAIAA
jgi:hypothetical protein